MTLKTIEYSYQIVSGHTRVKAAGQAGLTKILCCVDEISDDDAFLDLVRCNSQGELSPLEIGIHALTYAETAQGKAGKGLQAYADGIGKEKSTISRLREAANVYTKLVATCQQVNELLDKSRHLYHISNAPEPYWEKLAELLIQKQWSVKQTEEIVKAISDICIPALFQHWLNPDAYIKRTISEVVDGTDIRTPKDDQNIS